MFDVSSAATDEVSQSSRTRQQPDRERPSCTQASGQTFQRGTANALLNSNTLSTTPEPKPMPVFTTALLRQMSVLGEGLSLECKEEDALLTCVPIFLRWGQRWEEELERSRPWSSGLIRGNGRGAAS